MNMIKRLPKFIRGPIVRSRLPELESRYLWLTIKPVTDLATKAECFKLVYETYLNAGYIHTNERGPHSVEHESLATFAAINWADGDMLITASIFGDDQTKGLPIDSEFRAQVDYIRRDGRKVVEVGALAADRTKSRGDKVVPLLLDFAMIRYCIETIKAGSIVITTHPKYQHIYEDILLFEKIGYAKKLAYVNDNPAVAMHLDLRSLKERMHSVYGKEHRRWNPYDYIFSGEL